MRPVTFFYLGPDYIVQWSKAALRYRQVGLKIRLHELTDTQKIDQVQAALEWIDWYLSTPIEIT